VFSDPQTRHHEAIAEAELDVEYGGSPIVGGDAHPALAPGHRLPDTIGIRLDGAIVGMHALAHRAGHTAILVGEASVPDDELARLADAIRAGGDDALVGETVVLTTRSGDRHGWGWLEPSAAERLGIGEATLLVVRPDGHVGLRADRDHVAALASYQSLLATPRR
jgi:hypothetical protein